MAGSKENGMAGHFGRQVRKERLAHGWSLDELSRRTGINAAHLSRIENGRRPPTEALAKACDTAFPERRGWFSDWYDESRTWAEVPPGFRSWAEVEEKAMALRDWWPSIISGLQTEDYARALIAVQPAVTDEITRARLASRMERQRRVLYRDGPPSAWFVVDELALYRRVGSTGVMAAQMQHLATVATMPNVTVTIMPAIAYPANASGFIIAGNSAAYAEHMAGGFTYTDDGTVSTLAMRFDSLRGECYRVSESAALIERLGEIWTAGESPLTRTATAGPA